MDELDLWLDINSVVSIFWLKSLIEKWNEAVEEINRSGEKKKKNWLIRFLGYTVVITATIITFGLIWLIPQFSEMMEKLLSQLDENAALVDYLSYSDQYML